MDVIFSLPLRFIGLIWWPEINVIPVFLLISRTQLISCSLFLGNHLHILCLFQLLTVISNIDDLNYPEKTDTYFVVNAPYIFSACWKVCFIFISDETYKTGWFSLMEILRGLCFGRLLGLFCIREPGTEFRCCQVLVETSYWRYKNFHRASFSVSIQLTSFVLQLSLSAIAAMIPNLLVLLYTKTLTLDLLLECR